MFWMRFGNENTYYPKLEERNYQQNSEYVVIIEIRRKNREKQESRMIHCTETENERESHRWKSIRTR